MTNKNKYQGEHSDKQAEDFARQGKTRSEIAKEMGISRATLHKWIKKYPSFAEALRAGEFPVDVSVENSLLSRALGRTYREKKTIIKTDSSGKQHKEVQVFDKFLPPDTGACIFWLCNRRQDKWQNKRTIDGDALHDLKVEIKGITSEYEKRIKEEAKKAKRRRPGRPRKDESDS